MSPDPDEWIAVLKAAERAATGESLVDYEDETIGEYEDERDADAAEDAGAP